MVTPLLAIEASHKPLRTLECDIVIFISTNAVHYAQDFLDRLQHSNIQCYAVGQATYEALIEKGIATQQAPLDNQKTEGLLSLPELQSIAGQRILIVRGVGGRETLAEQLSARGANVEYWEVYQRVCPQLNMQAITDSWQHNKVDTIVVTSGAILKNLMALTPKELFPWLLACHIIVPSSRVATQAQQAGFSKVTNANAADSQSMFNALDLNHIEH